MKVQLHVLLTRWPTLDTSPQVMGPLVVMVAAGFNTEGCGAMTTGDWVAVVTKGWKKANQTHTLQKNLHKCRESSEPFIARDQAWANYCLQTVKPFKLEEMLLMISKSRKQLNIINFFSGLRVILIKC